MVLPKQGTGVSLPDFARIGVVMSLSVLTAGRLSQSGKRCRRIDTPSPFYSGLRRSVVSWPSSLPSPSATGRWAV